MSIGSRRQNFKIILQKLKAAANIFKKFRVQNIFKTTFFISSKPKFTKFSL